MRRAWPLLLLLGVLAGCAWLLLRADDAQRDERPTLDLTASGTEDAGRPPAALAPPDNLDDERAPLSVEGTTAAASPQGGEGQEQDAVASAPGLAVRVVDEAGGWVVGIPVALRRNSDPPFDLQRGVTDAAGMAVFRDAEQTLATSSARYGYVVALALPLPTPVQHVLNVDALPVDPVVLTAPPLGGLRVHVLDPAGAPLAIGGARVTAVAREADAPLHPEYGSMPYGANAGFADVVDGVASFPFVALNQRYELTFSAPGASANDPLAVVGPAEPGEWRDVEYSPLDAARLIVARLIQADGTPYANRKLDAVLRTSGSSASRRSARLVTNGAGIVWRRVDHSFQPGTTRTFELLAQDGDGGVQIDVSYPLATGTNDLGAHELRAAPLALAGSARDPEGAPLGGLTLRIEERQATRDGTQWRAFAPSTLRTAGDGTFELRGWFAEGVVLRLMPTGSRYDAEPVEAKIGDTGVLVIARPRAKGRIVGRVTVDEGLPLAELFVGARHVDHEDVYFDTLGADGSFELGGLKPGVHRLWVGAVDLRANLIEVDGIQVVPNEDARDPRLDPLDLRGLVQLVLLDVTDADDAPLRELVTRYRPSGPRERWSSKRTQGARRIILVTRGRVDVELEAYGYRSQQLTSIAGEHRVVMQRGYPVRIVLAGGLPQLANGLEILIRVTNPGRDGQDIFGGPKPVDAAGELAFEAARTATYAAQAYVRRRADGKEHLIGIGQTDPSQLQVVDSSAEQVFVLALDGERLESALRTLAKD